MSYGDSRRQRAGAACIIVAAAATLLSGACGGAASPLSVARLGAEERTLLADLLIEEDRRPDLEQTEALRRGLVAENPLLRRFAARGLGRLENADALDALAPALTDESSAVRSQAANAVAQSVFNESSSAAADVLRGRLAEETDAAVRGALAQALGRLRPSVPGALDETQAILVEITRGAPIETLLPTMRGLEWLARANRADLALTAATTDRLAELAHYGRSGAEGYVEPPEGGTPDPELTMAAARVRRLALATLSAASAIDADTVATALYDPDIEVRRLAAAAAGSVQDALQQPILLRLALEDDAPAVRYEGLRGYSRRLRLQMGCAPIIAALDDEDPQVALQAIDLLALGCPADAAANAADPRAAALLRELAESTPGLPDDDVVRGPRDGINPPIAAAARASAAPVAWHRGTHALLSLARLDADAAAVLIPYFALHPTWQVRMYAARAAGVVGAVDTLEQLADDPRPNVADAALRAMAENLGAGASGAAIAALDSNDYQLLITAANALEASDSERAVPSLVEALARITAQQRETSRDPRVALLERIGELGDAADADEVRAYLSDFDPRIARLAAEILLAWTGDRSIAAPRPPAPQPFPSIDELLELERSVARIHLLGGGIVEIELHPFEAPTNVARFARQSREGYFEGLTFHRVVPNFVVQGGSPGASEYVGDGPYSRDEVDVRSHLRGTVGISTRGRDTGDSQIFINLVDNVRLDHNYTIIGTVISGMDAVDAVLEGATIERITIERKSDTDA